jgi:hypothetical protein
MEDMMGMRREKAGVGHACEMKPSSGHGAPTNTLLRKVQLEVLL